MDHVIRYLDAHSGSVIVLVTVAYVLITGLLLFEARANRALGNVANLDTHPRPYGEMYIELVLENYGPAIARSVRFRRWIEVDGVVVEGTDRVQAEPMFPVGRRRRFFVSTRDREMDSLQELSDQKAVLRAEWTWTDSRRRLWFWTASHRASVTYRSEELRDGFYGGWALRERDPVEHEDRVFEEMKKARTAVEGIAKTLKDPAMKVYLQKMLEDAAGRPVVGAQEALLVEGEDRPGEEAGRGSDPEPGT